MDSQTRASVVSSTCILCGSSSGDTVLEVPPSPNSPHAFHLIRCSCGLVRTQPQLTSSELESHYREGYWSRPKRTDLSAIRRDQRHKIAFLERFRQSGRLLDVGCGFGTFLRALDQSRWDRFGLEAMPIAHCEASLHLGNTRIFFGQLANAPFSPSYFDVLTFWDVLEHVSDPVSTLQTAFRLLRPGGHVLLSLPNIDSYQFRRFRQDWFALQLPFHLYHFTETTLRRLFSYAGFQVITAERCAGIINYHSLKHSLLTRMTRLHGNTPGRLRYYLLKPFLYPWEWLSSTLGGPSSLQLCARRPTLQES